MMMEKNVECFDQRRNILYQVLGILRYATPRY